MLKRKNSMTISFGFKLSTWVSKYLHKKLQQINLKPYFSSSIEAHFDSACQMKKFHKLQISSNIS